MTINRALDNVKILDFSELIAGPFCSKLLADLGAEVVKVEKVGVGDIARRQGPFLNNVPNPEGSGLFLWLNTSKLGITLDVASPEGAEIFKQLVKETDILIEDKQPRFMEEMGLRYDTLKELNPKLVMCSITPFGQTGPYANYNAFPLNTFHSGGEGFYTPGGDPFPGRPPLKVGKFVGEYSAGAVAAGAVLCALFYQRATGSGQYIDISKQEALLALNQWELHRYPSEGFLTTKATRGYRIAGVLPCKDGFVEFSPIRDAEWIRLLEWMGNPEWAQGDSIRTADGREKHASEIKEYMKPWFMDRNKEELSCEAQQRHIPIVPCRS